MSNKTLKNTTAAPITLILTQTERVRVLPGQGAVITDAQLKLIKANSGMTITQRANDFRRELDVLTHAINDDKVIAKAMHLGEFYFHNVCHCALIFRG